jgi:N-methylhydantoinase B/oxoprolinase/acetone carboxylase alpha subunit
MPHYSEGDLMAQMASCNRGCARVHDLFVKYGHETMLQTIDDMLDATERRMRDGIRSVLREGTYSAVDWLDEDGVTRERVRLAVTLTIKDGHLTLDLSDCSPQLGSGKNVPLTQPTTARPTNVIPRIRNLIARNARVHFHRSSVSLCLVTKPKIETDLVLFVTLAIVRRWKRQLRQHKN